MNIILQKRIEEAAENIVEDYNHYQFLNDGTKDVYTQSAVLFMLNEMAQFILSNQWISVDEAMPQIREKDIGNRSWSDWVLVMTHGGGAFMDCYAFHRKEWLNNGNDVTHWMSIPSLKGCEK